MMSHMILFLLVLVINAQNPTTDEMKFPLWEEYTYKTYSGLIPVGDGTRQIHYIFVESMNDPTTDPVVLWLNGGPGCSSLLGLLEEIGPQVLEAGQETFSAHPNPWNQKVNLLFIESPAGVGYSTNTNPDYQYTDPNTANDNYEAIKKWFEGFAQFKGRDFWIAGESYAGMYIPYTATALVEGNKAASDPIRIKGIMIGNGLLVYRESAIVENSMIKYFTRRNFVDKVTQRRLHDQCTFAPTSISCEMAVTEFYLDCLAAKVNPYNVYGYCPKDTSNEQSKSKIKYPYTPWLNWNKLAEKVGDDNAPCSDFGATTRYLNRDDVKQALHVSTEIKWSACNDEIFYKYQVASKGSIELLPALYEAGLKILIYSGDQDAAVSTVQTIDSLATLQGLIETKGWRPYGNSDQVLAGWITEYNYLTFIIIRGAGHMVPTDQRQNGYEMFQGFIDGTFQ